MSKVLPLPALVLFTFIFSTYRVHNCSTWALRDIDIFRYGVLDGTLATESRVVQVLQTIKMHIPPLLPPTPCLSDLGAQLRTRMRVRVPEWPLSAPPAPPHRRTGARRSDSVPESLV